jgi:hypothetical protein
MSVDEPRLVHVQEQLPVPHSDHLWLLGMQGHVVPGKILRECHIPEIQIVHPEKFLFFISNIRINAINSVEPSTRK